MTYTATLTILSPIAGEYLYPIESYSLDSLARRVMGAVEGVTSVGAVVKALTYEEVPA